MMIIFIILTFLILMKIKFKIFIYFEIKNLDSFFSFRIGFIKFKRNGKLIAKKKNLKEKSKNKLFKIDFVKILKYAEIKKVNININIGTPFIFFNIYLIPFLTILLEYIKMIKKINTYSYNVNSNFNEFNIYLKGECILKTNLLNILIYALKIPKKVQREHPSLDPG